MVEAGVWSYPVETVMVHGQMGRIDRYEAGSEHWYSATLYRPAGDGTYAAEPPAGVSEPLPSHAAALSWIRSTAARGSADTTTPAAAFLARLRAQLAQLETALGARWTGWEIVCPACWFLDAPGRNDSWHARHAGVCPRCGVPARTAGDLRTELTATIRAAERLARA